MDSQFLEKHHTTSSVLYLFAFVYHLLDDALNPLKLGTHAGAGTDGCNCLIQGSRLIGVRHLPFPDRLFPLFRPIKLELRAVSPESWPLMEI